VFSWNGEKYEYIADVGGALPRSLTGNDYAHIDADTIATKDGKYSINVSQEYNEIVYYDEMKLVTFDHEPGYSVVSPLMRDTLSNPSAFITVSDTPTHPLQSCVDMYGNNCLTDLRSY